MDKENGYTMYIDKTLKSLKMFCKGDFEMYAQCSNIRPAYTDNEISLLFRQKRLSEHKELDEVAATIGREVSLIKYIDEGNCSFSSEMLEAAARYLGIPYEKLTAVTYDDNKFSCRGHGNKEAEDLFDMVNILFHQMILQQKLSK